MSWRLTLLIRRVVCRILGHRQVAMTVDPHVGLCAWCRRMGAHMTPEDRFDLALRGFFVAVVAFAIAMSAFLVVVIWRVTR